MRSRTSLLLARLIGRKSTCNPPCSMKASGLIVVVALLASVPHAALAQGGGFFGAPDRRVPANQFSRVALSSEGIVAATDRDAKCVRLWDLEQGRRRGK